MNLVIAGSRYSQPAMEALARSIVHEGIPAGLNIHVGDNPLGIDRIVQDAAVEIGGADQLFVYFITQQPRYYQNMPGVRLVRVENTLRLKGAAMFRWRDAQMIDVADRAAFIWDGRSIGTKVGYDYAMRKLDPEQVFMMVLKGGRMIEYDPSNETREISP